MTSTHSGWRGRRWCWSVQQTTRQRVPQCTIAGNRAEQSPTKGAVCRPSRHRLSDEVFAARRSSRPCRECNDKSKQPSSGDNALYTRSVRRGGERVVLGDHRTTRSEHVGQHVDGRTARRDNASPGRTKAPHCEDGVCTALVRRD